MARSANLSDLAPLACWECHSTGVNIIEDDYGNKFMVCKACNPTSTIEENIAGCAAVCCVCGGICAYDNDNHSKCAVCCLIICESCEGDAPYHADPETDEIAYYCGIKCSQDACERRAPRRIRRLDLEDST
jgi:hypothetical protein